MNSKVVVLMGMSCGGKDTVRRVLENKYNYKNIISYTSRPMRVGEIDGADYHFVSKQEFQRMIDNNEMIECRTYNTCLNGVNDTWYYGIRKFELEDNTNYVIVMDLKGAESLIDYIGDEYCKVIYLYANDLKRQSRAVKRGSYDKTEWNRRLIADKEDFSYTNMHYFRIKHWVWEIENEIYGTEAINEIAQMIDFIVQERLR